MKNEKDNKKENNNSLVLIPKIEKYIEYVLNMLVKLPRVEKFSIGNEYKTSIYRMLEETMYLNKINSIEKEKVKNKIQIENIEYLKTLNKIDSCLNSQRMYLRIMNNNHWIDSKKFLIAMEHTYEIGKILGGLFKYYAKNNTK